MAPPLGLRFVTSAPDLSALPPTAAEVAVVGRSNVGKSSLINALANRKHLAHVSKTPGRTQLLNMYEVAGGGSLMDLPGYGFAAVSKQTRSTWPRMIEGYLLGRDHLVMVMVLVDGEIGPTSLDVTTLARLRGDGLPLAVVATKHDKVRSSHRPRRRAELAEGCGLAPADVLWASAAKGTGIDELRGHIRRWLAAG